ncbi:polysaccharide deacetylase family protein [Nocardioides sp.]|uniref:polysaccharide deacetylase family protein n=1 Tax=Nocardioides sp. TaxID=35761 RepID=UPI002ED4A6D8
MDVRGRAAVAVTVATVVAGLGVVATPSTAALAPRAGCSSGYVALTFDDGPSDQTERLVRILRRAGAPATFFMVGERVAAAPRVARRVERAGFLIANHSWAHQDMRTQSAAGVTATLRATERVLRRAGTHPTRMMRPPYGALDDAARKGIRTSGLIPVLWTVDSRDWTGGTARQIATRILSALRPGAPNVVLQHDGIGHSPVSISAVRAVIRGARSRGYCFTALDEDGRPGFPTPRIGLSVTDTREGTPAVATVRLDRPAGRRTSVWLRTRTDSATAGSDFTRLARRVTIRAGRLSARVRVPVPRDRLDEYGERFRVSIGRPRGVRIGTRQAFASIADADPPPAVRGRDLDVVRPAGEAQTLPVTFVLSRPSGKPITVVVATRPGTAQPTDYTPFRRRLQLSPGTTHIDVDVTVLADPELLSGSDEFFTVEVLSARRARMARAATVTIHPPQPPQVPDPARVRGGLTRHR